MIFSFDLTEVDELTFEEIYTRRWTVLRILLRFYFTSEEFPEEQPEPDKARFLKARLWEHICMWRVHDRSRLYPFEGVMVAECTAGKSEECSDMAVGESDIKKLFGFRTRPSGRVPQPWCYACRRQAMRDKRAAVRTAQSGKES